MRENSKVIDILEEYQIDNFFLNSSIDKWDIFRIDKEVSLIFVFNDDKIVLCRYHDSANNLRFAWTIRNPKKLRVDENEIDFENMDVLFNEYRRLS